MLDPAGTRDVPRLPDVRFRLNPARGRVVWNHSGEEYTKYFLPPNLRDGEFTAMSLNSEMDHADVDVALLHTDPMLGRGAAYVAFLGECVRRFPERLRSMAPVDEYRIATEPAAVVEQLDEAIHLHGLHALKFCTSLAYMAGSEAWDDGPYRPFWEAVEALGIPVFFTLGSGPPELDGRTSDEQQREGYLAELRVLMRWMGRYPDTVCSLTHGFPYRLFLEGERIELPDAVWEPFTSPNCSVEVCFPVRLGDLFDYPYREIWPVLQCMAERIGANQLMWGTDMPFQNRFCTYRQSRRWIEDYCEFLSPDDLTAIMGGTAARVLGV